MTFVDWLLSPRSLVAFGFTSVRVATTFELASSKSSPDSLGSTAYEVVLLLSDLVSKDQVQQLQALQPNAKVRLPSEQLVKRDHPADLLSGCRAVYLPHSDHRPPDYHHTSRDPPLVHRPVRSDEDERPLCRARREEGRESQDSVKDKCHRCRSCPAAPAQDPSRRRQRRQPVRRNQGAREVRIHGRRHCLRWPAGRGGMREDEVLARAHGPRDAGQF